MGYQTDFRGRVLLDRPLTVADKLWLDKFNDEDHRYGDKEKEYPGIWCQWRPTEDGTGMEWDGQEKFYNYIEWMEWLVKHFFEPKGYVLNGTIDWVGEDAFDDRGTIIVDNNKVSTKEYSHGE